MSSVAFPTRRGRPRRSVITLIAMVVVVTSAATARAGEFGADAEVLEREAVYRTITEAPRCSYPQAPLDASLGALLRWDVGQAKQVCEGASHRRELEGYRVTYRWNGRRFTDFMHDDPGDSLRVRVHVD